MTLNDRNGENLSGAGLYNVGTMKDDGKFEIVLVYIFAFQHLQHWYFLSIFLNCKRKKYCLDLHFKQNFDQSKIYNIEIRSILDYEYYFYGFFSYFINVPFFNSVHFFSNPKIITNHFKYNFEQYDCCTLWGLLQKI